MTTLAPIAMGGAIEIKDLLDNALAPPEDIDSPQRTNRLVLSAGNTFSYDNNIYRLPANVTNLAALPGIGSNPSREDYIDSISAGLDGEWLVGNRQSFDVDLAAQDNRYIRNDDLNNVSTNDRVTWNWGLGGALSGKVGADYVRLLGGFTNTLVYSPDVVNRSDYFASTRYQLGPRWAIFGGLMGSVYSVSSAQATYNNSTSRSADVGADYTNEGNRIGFDYRYNDSRAPNSTVLNGTLFDPDFREDRARVLFRYALSEKTIVDASVGYLKREYPTNAIGSFSGEIWRAALQWQPTPKTQLLFGVWQQLDADLTSQTDYFRDRGVSLTPEWIASEKLIFSAIVSRDTNNYIGSNPLGPIPVVPISQARHDTLTSESANVAYTPIKALALSLSIGHVTRASNISQFQYNDLQASASVTYKFLRYGDNL
jgi:exopolysaccharide biosynthesis operon protein EpsL